MVVRNGVKNRVMAILCAVIMVFGVCAFAGMGHTNVDSPFVVAKAAGDDGTTSQSDASSIMDKMVSSAAGTIKGYNDGTAAGGSGTGTHSATKMTSDTSASPTGLVDKTQNILQIVLGVCCGVVLIAGVVFGAKMAVSGADPQGRKKAVTGLMWCGIALAIFGSLEVVVSFFWNFLAGVS